MLKFIKHNLSGIDGVEIYPKGSKTGELMIWNYPDRGDDDDYW